MGKYRAPIVILILMTIVFSLWGFMYLRIFSGPEYPGFVRIIIVITAIAVISLLTAVFIQRVKEISKGEEDDISKY